MQRFNFTNLSEGYYSSVSQSLGGVTVTVNPAFGFVAVFDGTNPPIGGLPQGMSPNAVIGSDTIPPGVGTNKPILTVTFSPPVSDVTFYYGDNGGDSDTPVVITPQGQAPFVDTYPVGFNQTKTYHYQGPAIASAVIQSGTQAPNTNSNTLFWQFSIPDAPSGCSCQIGFHGVRRVAGKSPLAETYPYCPKSFTYKIPFVIDRPNGAPYIRVAQQITDYDFELHDIKIVYDTDTPVVKCKAMVLDMNRNQIFSKPALDVFINELSYYGNGSIVPPLFYQKDSQFFMQVYSLLASGEVPINAELQLIGIQRYPR